MSWLPWTISQNGRRCLLYLTRATSLQLSAWSVRCSAILVHLRNCTVIRPKFQGWSIRRGLSAAWDQEDPDNTPASPE